MTQLAPPKRRDKLLIMGEILQITRHGALKTQIMYRANLSFAQLNEYLAQLTATQMVRKTTQLDKETYMATEKGLNFLKKQQELLGFLNQDAEYPSSTDNPQSLLVRTRKEEN